MKRIIPFLLFFIVISLFVGCSLDFDSEDLGPTPSEETLATMRFAQVLATSTRADGSDTTDNFKNSDLIQLFLAGLEYIDTTTLDFYYLNNDVKYYFYGSSLASAKPENVLYYEINYGTSVSRYSSEKENGRTVIEVDGLNITANLAPGKFEDGKVVRDGDFFEGRAISLILQHVKLTMESDGSFEIEILDGAGNFKSLKMTNETKKYTTASSFVFKKEEPKTKVEEESKLTFCTVTFDPDNGDAKETKQVIYGTKIAKPSTSPKAEDERNSFSVWTLNGKEYEFSSRVTSNLELKAKYVQDFKTILQAESIYKIATILPKYNTLYDEDNQTFSALFPDNTTDVDKDLATILLCSKFFMNEDEKVYVSYEGTDYEYETNADSFTIYKVAEKINLGKNNSSENKLYSTIKLDDFKLALQFKHTSGSKLQTYSETFSIEEVYAKTEGITVVTAVFTAGGKTYPTLIATATELEDGTTEVVFSYDGYRFTRIY